MIKKYNFTRLMLTRSLLPLLVLILTGCGFHLRGAIELPELYERVYLVDRGYNDISKPLSQALESVGTKMLSSSDSATAVVTLLSRGMQRKALNVGGKEVKEYELQLDVSFVVQNAQGEQLDEQQTVSVVRNYRNDNDNVLGMDNEEKTIRGEMNQSAVIQILRRMKALAEK